MSDDDTLSCRQAAELLGRTPGTVATWCERGYLPGATRTGRPAGPGARTRAWRIPRATLAEMTGSGYFLTAAVTPPHGPRQKVAGGKAEFRSARRAAEPEPGDQGQAEGKAPPRAPETACERVERSDPAGFQCPACGRPLVMERKGAEIRCRECGADLEVAAKRQTQVVFRATGRDPDRRVRGPARPARTLYLRGFADPQ